MRFLPPLLALLAACAPQIKHRDPETRLDRAIFLREQDLSGRPHPLSARTADGAAVERVPAPGEVDVNSTLQIKLLKDGLLPRGAEPPELQPLSARRVRLVQALNGLADYLAARQKAIDAYPNPGFDEGYGKSTRAYLGLLRDLWPRNTPDRDRLDAAWMSDPVTLAPLQAFFQEEIDALDARYRRAAETLRTRGISLRLEAFLDSPGAVPTALHLEGYDTLEARRVQVHDRFGLALSARERESLDEALAASREIADAAGRVLRREASVREAFSKATLRASRRLGEIADQVAALGTFKDRFAALAADFRAFRDRLKNELPAELKQAGRDALARVLESLQKGVDDNGARLDAELLLGLPARLLAVKDNPSIPAALALARDLQLAIQSRDTILQAIEEIAGKVAKAIEEALKEEAAQVRDSILQKWNESDLKKRVAELDRDVRRAIQLVRDAAAVLGLHALPPAAPALKVPEALDVPLADAPNTGLDLTRTSRLVGDTLTLRASLVQEGQVVETAESSFVVREFGWHADLQPGVVLLSPWDDSAFDFAPEVSWLWRLHPRPEDTDLFSAISRFLQPSIGLHAAFPNTVPDKEVEIGLGVSAAFWGDRVVAGAGYNLMHETSKDDVYYFVGTSLIPILQSLGLGGPSAAGERP